jgi:hypothetical protein
MKQLFCTRLLVKAVLLCTSLSPAFAQPSTLRQELLKDWMDMKDMMLKLANEMAEDQYSFKTTPAQRDFAQQVLHVANGNVINLNFLRGTATPPTIDRRATSKAAVMRAMADSFDYGAALIRSKQINHSSKQFKRTRFSGLRHVRGLSISCWDIPGISMGRWSFICV